MTALICSSCGEDAEHEENWDDETQQCNSCFEVGGTAYCCGQIYESGETICASCGDPL